MYETYKRLTEKAVAGYFDKLSLINCDSINDIQDSIIKTQKSIIAIQDTTIKTRTIQLNACGEKSVEKDNRIATLLNERKWLFITTLVLGGIAIAK